jgi:hypothetical protein
MIRALWLHKPLASAWGRMKVMEGKNPGGIGSEIGLALVTNWIK